MDNLGIYIDPGYLGGMIFDRPVGYDYLLFTKPYDWGQIGDIMSEADYTIYCELVGKRMGKTNYHAIAALNRFMGGITSLADYTGSPIEFIEPLTWESWHEGCPIFHRRDHPGYLRKKMRASIKKQRKQFFVDMFNSESGYKFRYKKDQEQLADAWGIRKYVMERDINNKKEQSS